MNIAQSKSDKLFDITITVLGIIIMILILYPLYFIVIASFSNPAEVANGNVWLIPKGITFEGYKRIFQNERIWTGYRNTIMYTLLGTSFSVLFTIPAGYALSRKDLKGRVIIMIYFLVTMFFNGGLIPTFLTIQKFHLLNTIWVIVLPFSVSIFNIIIIRSYFMSNIPDELLESAQLDGCSNTRFFISIVLPLSKPIIAVIALFCVVGQWNQYFSSLIYVRDPNLVPLQLVLRNILLQNKVLGAASGGVAQAELQKMSDIIKYGVIVVSTLPVLCVYPFIQKYFDKGIMIGAVKG